MSVPDSPASQRPAHIRQGHWDELTIGSAIAPDVIRDRDYKKALGISDRTMRRAKQSVGVAVFNQSYDGPWMWNLAPMSQVAQVSP